MLYRDNVLLYDRETESLWSQVLRKGVTGELTGKKLATLPYTLTNWKKWKKRYPDTLVLSSDTGYRRDYSKDPYEDYYKSPFSFFRTSKPTPILSEKTLVFGIELGGIKRAYPLEELREFEGSLKDHIGELEVIITADGPGGEIRAREKGGREIPGLVTYWFVWHKFHPESGVYGKGQ